jgi:hypothetical protein
MSVMCRTDLEIGTLTTTSSSTGPVELLLPPPKKEGVDVPDPFREAVAFEEP